MITLTAEQKLAIDGLKKWANNDKGANMAVLSGYAGTGKTTALQFFLEDYKYRVAITAPTHKAVFIASTILGRKGQTLHKLHGLRPNTNLATFNIDNVKFDPLGEPSIGDYKLVIIDEASMINKGLLELNAERAKLFGVKILFVGDPLQLTPVGETEARAFSLPTHFKLTTVMRQHEDNSIGYVMTLLRNDIKNNNGYDAVNYMLRNPINVKKIDGVTSGYGILNRENFNTKLLDEISKIEGGTDVRYLAYTNNTVIQTNSYIRNNLIRSDDIITSGDRITSNINTYDEFQSMILTNSSDYIVDSVEKRDSDYDFEVYVVNMRNLTDNSLVPPVMIVNHLNEAGFNKYKEILKVFHNAATNSDFKKRSKKWYEYYQFKNAYLQMVQLTMSGMKVDRDLSYAYASTIHKSQGSTYDISLINLKSIVLTQAGTFRKNSKTYAPFAISAANRLLYVALSRAKEKSILLWQ